MMQLRHHTLQAWIAAAQGDVVSVLGKQVGGLPVLSLPCVGGRMVRRCKSLIPICYCSRNSSLSLTPSTNPYSGSKID